MLVPFYDNLEATSSDDGTDLIEVERISCFDWDCFQKIRWKDLSDIYTGLPRAVRYLDVPWWFVENEESPFPVSFSGTAWIASVCDTRFCWDIRGANEFS
jgi:hypothetical protein